MIEIDKGATHIVGDTNLLINEMAIGLMAVCQSLEERIGVSEDVILEQILKSLQGQKLGRSGMDIDMMEEVLGVEIDRDRTDTLNGEG